MALRASLESDARSHILYLYAHGSNNHKMFDVLRSMTGEGFIFLDSLAATIKEVMAAGKDVYVVANSCYWNLKYGWGFPSPTISFGPDKSTRLPFPSEYVELKLAALPDEFTKSVFLEWITELQATYKWWANKITCYGEGGKTIDVEEFRIIELSATAA